MPNSSERIPGPVEVVPATLADAEKIHEIVKRGWHEIFVNERGEATPGAIEHIFSEESTQKRFEKLKSDLENGFRKFLIAKKGDEVVGVLIWQETEGCNYASGFYVNPEARGAGIALINAARKAMNPKKNVALWVVDHNQATRTLYEKLGFTYTGKEKTDELETPYGIVNRHQLEMTRRLG